MPRKRDFSAEWAARVERAQAAGFQSVREYSRARQSPEAQAALESAANGHRLSGEAQAAIVAMVSGAARGDGIDWGLINDFLDENDVDIHEWWAENYFEA